MENFIHLFAIYFKLTFTIYEKSQTQQKSMFTIKNSLNKRLIWVNYPK